MKQLSFFKTPLSTGTFLGILGGLIFSGLMSLKNIGCATKFIETGMLFSFVALSLVAVLKVDVKEGRKKFLRLFGASFITCVLTFIGLYVYLIIIMGVHQFELRYFLLMCAVSGLGCLALSFLAAGRR